MAAVRVKASRPALHAIAMHAGRTRLAGRGSTGARAVRRQIQIRIHSCYIAKCLLFLELRKITNCIFFYVIFFVYIYLW